jgi:beta-glucanase (GH16 family)
MKKAIILMSFFATFFQVFTQNYSNAFTENFDVATVTNFFYESGGQKAEFTRQSGVESQIEAGTKVMRIAMDPQDDASPYQGPNFYSNNFTLFGRYSARIKIPNVETQPGVGGVVGFFTYYNDLYANEQEKDINKNGLSDNSEIDFEWLIANPQLIYMTAWTDYEENGDCKKVARIVNLATGQILTTNYSQKLGGAGTPLTGVENQPSQIQAIAGFDASQNFYVYGFDWKSDNIRWWIIHPETRDTVVLWDYKGNTARITQKPARLMFNIWHTNDWSAEGKPGSTQKPAQIFAAEFDWIKYEMLEDIPDNTTRIKGAKRSKSEKGVISSVQTYSDKTVLHFNSVENADASFYTVNGRKLHEGKILKNECIIPNFSQKIIAVIKKNGKVIGKMKL